MPVVKDVEISVRQKKLMYADMLSELEMCSDIEELEVWEKTFEQEKIIITDNGQDEDWNTVINQKIEQQQQIITLKQELEICQ